MPYYLVEFSYTKEAVAALVRNPHNRIEAIRSALEDHGVTIRHSWLAFGKLDVLVVLEAPDNVRATISLVITAGGAVENLKTTPLMTWEEGGDAGGGKLVLSTPGRTRP
jgi:uncharacterized protein with GYD domain